MNTPTEIQFLLLPDEASTDVQLELLEVLPTENTARQAELPLEENS